MIEKHEFSDEDLDYFKFNEDKNIIELSIDGGFRGFVTLDKDDVIALAKCVKLTSADIICE